MGEKTTYEDIKQNSIGIIFSQRVLSDDKIENKNNENSDGKKRSLSDHQSEQYGTNECENPQKLVLIAPVISQPSPKKRDDDSESRTNPK